MFYLPYSWLANPNVNQLLIPGQLPTPVIPKRPSLIFLWEECSRKTPIPIVDPLLKNVYIFGGQWGAHSYLDSPKYNRITDNILNRPPLLVLTCWQFDAKLNVSFGKIIDECSFALVFDSHWYMLFLTYWQKNRKWMFVLLPKLVIIIFYFPTMAWINIVEWTFYHSLTASKIVT